ncbi:hypothetical protein BD410DRAFT_795596 [Rickenella mellea]|uniref:Protein kinase domain-containing protein n=1 Tax=Rickenella mellea TaxID=50990 RepID=A0A4Y7PL26_9AGAM|nr:hypothetical protein BD410DRAFT_795596 [Rickenella mellea]
MPSYYTPNSELVLELCNGRHLTVKVLKVFTPFSRSQVSLVTRVTEVLHELALPSIFIIKTFDPRFYVTRWDRKGADRWPWSQQAEAEAEALRRQGTPKQWQYDLPDKGDLVGWEQYCYQRMDYDFSIETRAYDRLQHFQGDHIPSFYGEAALVTTDVKRAIVPRTLLIQYIPNALPIHKINKDLITPTLAKSFLTLIKSFHACGVVHNDMHQGNILVAGSSKNDQTHAVVIDFGEACLREEGETEEEWAATCGDTKCMLRQLQEYLGTDDIPSFIGEPIDVYA